MTTELDTDQHPPSLAVISENNGVTTWDSRSRPQEGWRYHHNTNTEGLIMFAKDPGARVLQPAGLIQEPLSIHRLLSDNARASGSFQAFMKLNNDRSEWNRKINASFGL